MKITAKSSRHFGISQKGFSLIELLVVITIILVLSGLTIGGMKFAAAKQNIEKCKTNIKLLETGLEEYKMDEGEYPPHVGTGSQTLFNFLFRGVDNNGSPIRPGPTQKVYIAELDPNNLKLKWTMAQGGSFRVVDPWLLDINYRRGLSQDGSTPEADAKNPDFDLWSAGPDGIFTPADNALTDRDNITNWR